ncbi:hypothetical protein GGF32_006913 [Allomyces javanicus]|nr:hypothetical protein GGF32_006913 [Allomyces javanicus]
MPALRVLQFDEGWDYLHGERKTLWTVPSTAAWATTMPHLEALNYMARFVKISGLAHPSLHDLVASVPAWNWLVQHSLDLPRLLNVTITGGDQDFPPLMSLCPLLPGGGMSNVVRIDVNCQEALTVTAAGQLTRVCAREIRRRCEASKELTVINAEYARAIRVEYTQDNVCSLQLLFKSALISPDSRPGNVPRTVEVGVAPGVNGIDLDWLELLIEWSARLFMFGITQEVILRAVGGANLVELVGPIWWRRHTGMRIGRCGGPVFR